MEDVNERLMEAAEGGAEAELKALLMDSGCNALATDKWGWTALMWAAYGGSEACVRLLLPVSYTRAKDENEQTALMWASRYGHDACVRLLLPVSDVLATCSGGLTALMWAAAYGHKGCVQLILPVSNALGEGCQTASNCAHDHGHESVAYFIDAYILAQSERDFIEAAAGSGAPNKTSGPRV